MKALPFLALLFAAPFLQAQETLPSPWKHQDIGPVELPGKAEFAADAFTLQGTMDLWGMADGCQFTWQPIHGDVELVARVSAFDNPGGIAHAKASLCLRESLDAGARSVTLCATAADGTQFLYREQKDSKTMRVTVDESAQKAGVPKGQFPCWLKLIRHGNEFSGFESTDGEQWHLTGKITLALPAESVIGLAASSHKKDIPTKVTFDHVSLQPQ